MNDNTRFFPPVPKVAQVVLEEIPGDLMTGVNYRVLQEINDKHTLRPVNFGEKFFYKHLDCADHCEDGSHVLNIEVLVRNPYTRSGPPLAPITLYGCRLDGQRDTRSVGRKFTRVSMLLRVSVEDNTPLPPYLQFHCTERLRVHDRVFYGGEIVTFFIRRNGGGRCPSPPVLVVKPSHPQTFLTMLPRQRLQLVLEAGRDQAEWREYGGCSLSHENTLRLDSNDHPDIGASVVMEYFDYSGHTAHPECIYVRRDTEHRAVIVTAPDTTNTPCAMVLDPVGTSLVLTQAVQGVKILAQSYLPMKVHEDCPVEVHYVFNARLKSEYKLRLRSPATQLLLERCTDHWMVRLP